MLESLTSGRYLFVFFGLVILVFIFVIIDGFVALTGGFVFFLLFLFFVAFLLFRLLFHLHAFIIFVIFIFLSVEVNFDVIVVSFLLRVLLILILIYVC